ncbi:MAG: FtsQ-type POTRA domain-containing protein [Candidatus Omnitrophica bacterium]|nr:FtsQ-type POTRA domain-containing protein [Candidatus Omnitrophota bacterium]
MVKLKKQKVRTKKRITFSQKPKIRLKGIAKFLLLVLAIAAVATGLAGLKYMFVDSDYFMIKGVDVKLYDESGSLREIFLNEIDGEEIKGTNIFMVDLNTLKEKLEASHSEYKDVVVRRLLPNKVIVKAGLRKAVAQIRSDRYYFVDREGVLLPDVKNFPDANLPIIIGMGVNLARVQASGISDFEKDNLDKALRLINEMQAIDELSGQTLKVVDITDPGNLTFSFEGTNVEIKIGNSDFSKRLNVLTTLLDQLGQDINEFKYIDLRFEDPIVGPR